MTPETAPRPRPYWHVDAKWISGLLLAVIAGLTLAAYSLVLATAEKPAVDTLSMALAVSLSGHGLDDETEIAVMRQRLEAAPGGQIQPIPGLNLTIRLEDLEGRTPRQARLALFRQLAEPIYRTGGLTDLAMDPEMRAAVSSGVGVLSFFSLQTHQLLQRIFTILALVCLGLALPLIYFSFGPGRLTSPGCVLVVASLPGAAVLAFLGWVFNPPASTPEAGADMTARLGALASEVLPPVAQLMARAFLIALALGLILILLSVIGRLVFRRKRS